MSELRWTAEKPTAPGWYWFRGAGDPEITRVRPHHATGELFSWVAFEKCPVSVMRGQWAGPIPEPAEQAGEAGT